MVHWHVFAHSAAALVGLAGFCRVRGSQHPGVRGVWICIHTRNQPPIRGAICAKHSLVRVGHNRFSILVWIVGRPSTGHARIAGHVGELVRPMPTLATFIFNVSRYGALLDDCRNCLHNRKLRAVCHKWFGRAQRSAGGWKHASHVVGVGRAIHGVWFFTLPRA